MTLLLIGSTTTSPFREVISRVRSPVTSIVTESHEPPSTGSLYNGVGFRVQGVGFQWCKV